MKQQRWSVKHAMRIILLICLILIIQVGAAVRGEGMETIQVKTRNAKELIITSPPDKVEYLEGEYFDPAGLRVQAVYADGSTEDNVPYTLKSDQPLGRYDYYVKVTYARKSLRIPITVRSIANAMGNDARYSVEATEALGDTPLSGKIIFLLGSSVTYGSASEQEAMGEFIAKRNGAICYKEAVPGTTLADNENPSGNSYLKRFEAYLASADVLPHVDVFVLQLSTNDRNAAATLGVVTDADVRDISSFDRYTTYGAMETIIALVKKTWNCPVLIYTNAYFADGSSYPAMVEAAKEMARKWPQVAVLDLFNDAAFNDITEDQRAIYMSDKIHPTKAGYREWWTPKFEDALIDLLR